MTVVSRDAETPPVLKPKPGRTGPRWTLRQSLGWLMVLALLPLATGGGLVLWEQRADQHRAVQQGLLDTAQALVGAGEGELASGRALLEALAASPQIDAGDWAGLQQHAISIVHHRPGSLLSVTDATGQLIFNTILPWGSPLPNLWRLQRERQQHEWQGRLLPLGSQDLTRSVFETGRPAFSDLYYSPSLQRPAVGLSVPIVRQGRVLAALSMALEPEALTRFLGEGAVAQRMRLTLLDREGRILATNTASAWSVADPMPPEFMARIRGARSGLFEEVAPDGVKVVGAYAVSESSGWTVRIAMPRHEAFAGADEAAYTWIVVFAAALVLGLGLASLLARRLTAPLAELAAATDSLQHGRAPEVSPSTVREIDTLRLALQRAAQWQRDRAEEQQRRLEAEAREAEAARTARILRESRERLREADRQKDEFLATLAHELRNPLAPIRSAAQVIRLRRPEDPAVARAGEMIERQSAHMARLVDDLLEVSRITLGRIELQLRDEPLAAIVQGAVEAAQPALEARGQHLSLGLPAEPLTLRADATRLSQALLNLLNNAVKFTPEGGRIALTARREAGELCLAVRDEGIGIEPGMTERIFGLFVQARTPAAQSGLGIGLALARRLVEMHGGTLVAASGGPGTGSTFTIRLPLAEPAAGPGPGPDAGSRTPSSPAAPARPARVLVVDDNVDAAESLRMMLELEGHEVRVAHDGASALAAWAAWRPPVVVLDLGLPDIEGCEVARRLRAQHGAQGPRLVALTGWGQAADRERAREAGFDHHFTKPVDPQALLEVVRHPDEAPAA